MNIKDLSTQIENVLRKYPKTRNSDILLMVAVWKIYYPDKIIDNTVKLGVLFKLPREDSIKRIRAKLQEEALERVRKGQTEGNEDSFLPTDPKVMVRRQINKDLGEFAMGYKRTPTNDDQKELFNN